MEEYQTYHLVSNTRQLGHCTESKVGDIRMNEQYQPALSEYENRLQENQDKCHAMKRHYEEIQDLKLELNSLYRELEDVISGEENASVYYDLEQACEQALYEDELRLEESRAALEQEEEQLQMEKQRLEADENAEEPAPEEECYF